MTMDDQTGAKRNSISISLSSPICRTVFVALVAAAAFLFCSCAWLDYAASRAANIGTYEGIQRAIRLSPGNARYWYIAGSYSLFGAQDVPTATQQFATSVHLNPWSAAAWLSLANAYQIVGDTEKERLALESAVQADPRTPDVSWEAGNFYFVQGDIASSARLFAAVIENDPDRSKRAFQLLWASKPDAQFILENAIPQIVDRHFLFLNFLCENGQFEAAQSVWKRIRGLRQPFPSMSAYPYLDFLIRTKHWDEASTVWEELADDNPSEIAHRGPNLVVNSSFEDAISNGGFDWRYKPSRGVTISVDPVVASAGSRSLAIVFDGAPPDAGVEQYVLVSPNSKYHFSVSMRSEDIQSSSGPRVAVYDAYDDKRYAMSDDMLETSVWHRQDIEFEVGPDTHLISIKIIREPSNAAIKGKLWIDDVQLRKE